MRSPRGLCVNKLGRMTVRQFGERERLRRGERRAVPQQRLAMPAGAVAFEGGGQRGVAGKQVVVRERRRLIGHVVSLAEAVPFHLLSPFTACSPVLIDGCAVLSPRVVPHAGRTARRRAVFECRARRPGGRLRVFHHRVAAALSFRGIALARSRRASERSLQCRGNTRRQVCTRQGARATRPTRRSGCNTTTSSSVRARAVARWRAVWRIAARMRRSH